MHKLNYLLKNYNKHCRNFEKNLDELKSSIEAEKIHQIRRTIKRLRAFYKFLSGFDMPGFDAKKHYAVLKDLFRKAGEIREIQLNLIAIDNYNLPADVISKYKNYLLRNFKKLCRECNLLAVNFDMNAFMHTKQMAASNFSQLRDDDIRNKSIHNIMRECGKITMLLKQKYTPQNIHEIRKRFKYLCVMFQFLYSLGKMKHIERIIKMLKLTEEKEGNWHDKVVLICSIENFLNTRPRSAKTLLKPMTELLATLKKENSEMVTDIIARINFTLMNIRF